MTAASQAESLLAACRSVRKRIQFRDEETRIVARLIDG